MLGSVELRCTGNVAAAIRVVGHGEALALVVDRDFLTGSLSDLYLGSPLKGCVVEGLDFTRYRGIENAVHVLGLTIDLGVTVACKVLEHVDEVVFGGIRHVLEAHGCLFVRVKIACSNRCCRRRHVVGRPASHLIGIGLGGCGGGDGVGDLVSLSLDDVGVEDNLGVSVVEIVVLGGNLIDINGAELRDNGDALRDDRISLYLFSSFLVDPLLEHLTGYEGILRHGADCFTFRAVVLGQLLCHGTVVVEDNESDVEVIFEFSFEGQVRSNLFSADIFRLANVPTFEGLAFDNGSVRKRKSVSGVVGVGLIDFRTVHEGHGKGVLGIFSPNVQIACGLDSVGIVATTVDPLAAIASLVGNSRRIVHAVVGVCIDYSGIYYRSFIFFVERDRISDRLILGHDNNIFFRDERVINRATDVSDCSILINGAHIPFTCMVIIIRNLRHLAANGFAFDNINRGFYSAIPIIKRNRPGLISLTFGRLYIRCSRITFDRCRLNRFDRVSRIGRFQCFYRNDRIGRFSRKGLRRVLHRLSRLLG